MDRADHHQEAKRLLLEAHKEHDSIRRSLILTEAQVYATLALADDTTIARTTGAGSRAPTESPFGDAIPGPSRPTEPEQRPRRTPPTRRISTARNKME